MEIKVLRVNDNSDSTIGLFYIDDVFQCFTIEDEGRTEKVSGQTRIWSGTYEIGLRRVGGFHERYLKKFPDMHEGMLEVLDVEGFEYILIHIGNEEDDTDGCLLVGTSCTSNLDNRGFIGHSTNAYKQIYPQILQALKNDEEVTITYINPNFIENINE